MVLRSKGLLGSSKLWPATLPFSRQAGDGSGEPGRGAVHYRAWEMGCPSLGCYHI